MKDFMTKPCLLILAAGMGSRYGGLKQLDGVGPNGETIMDYSVYDAVAAGFDKVVFVIRKHFRAEFEERIRSRYGNIVKFEFVEQELNKIPDGFVLNPEREKPWGTGHAMMMGAEVINTPFAVINADDYYGQQSFKVLADFLIDAAGKSGSFSMVGFEVSKTLSESGSVSRGVCTGDSSGNLLTVEEHHNIICEADGTITGTNSAGEKVTIRPDGPVSMNMWGFTPDIFADSDRLFSEFLAEKGGELKSEFYIPYIVNKLLAAGKATTRILETPDQWFGVTYKEDRDSVVQRLADLVKQGVYPSPLFN